MRGPAGLGNHRQDHYDSGTLRLTRLLQTRNLQVPSAAVHAFTGSFNGSSNAEASKPRNTVPTHAFSILLTNGSEQDYGRAKQGRPFGLAFRF